MGEVLDWFEAFCADTTYVEAAVTRKINFVHWELTNLILDLVTLLCSATKEKLLAFSFHPINNFLPGMGIMRIKFMIESRRK